MSSKSKHYKYHGTVSLRVPVDILVKLDEMWLHWEYDSRSDFIVAAIEEKLERLITTPKSEG